MHAEEFSFLIVGFEAVCIQSTNDISKIILASVG